MQDRSVLTTHASPFFVEVLFETCDPVGLTDTLGPNSRSLPFFNFFGFFDRGQTQSKKWTFMNVSSTRRCTTTYSFIDCGPLKFSFLFHPVPFRHCQSSHFNHYWLTPWPFQLSIGFYAHVAATAREVAPAQYSSQLGNWTFFQSISIAVSQATSPSILPAVMVQNVPHSPQEVMTFACILQVDSPSRASYRFMPVEGSDW